MDSEQEKAIAVPRWVFALIIGAGIVLWLLFTQFPDPRSTHRVEGTIQGTIETRVEILPENP